RPGSQSDPNWPDERCSICRSSSGGDAGVAIGSALYIYRRLRSFFRRRFSEASYAGQRRGLFFGVGDVPILNKMDTDHEALESMCCACATAHPGFDSIYIQGRPLTRWMGLSAPLLIPAVFLSTWLVIIFG